MPLSTCSPSTKLTARYSYSIPFRASTIRTRHAAELRQYEYRMGLPPSRSPPQAYAQPTASARADSPDNYLH